jgi:hypothetical protein
MGKRHFKGNNKSADRNRRKEKAEAWRNTRGDKDGNGNGDGDNAGRGYDSPTTNPRLEAFYKAQGFIHDDEWAHFMTALRSPLPACFRINSDYIFADDLAKELEQFISNNYKVAAGSGTGDLLSIDGHPIKPIERLLWYPNGYTYKVGTDRRNLRKHPLLQQLHK